MITQEFLNAMDDLLQAGAQASASLRAKVEGTQFARAVDSAAASVTEVAQTERTESSVPALGSAVANAVQQLINVAKQVGESDLANALSIRLQRARGAGLGAFPWLTVLGVAAGGIAIYFLWKNHKKKRALAVFEAPESDDVGPRIRNMGRALSGFRGPSFKGKASMGRCGPKRRRGLGAVEKYEFEPEIRLEGHRGSRRHRSRK